MRIYRRLSTETLQGHNGFSLVEVVLAVGVIGFAIVAILGVFPIGLDTSHSAQNETRAAQIAQDIFTSLSSQAQAKFPYLTIYQPASDTAPVFSYDIHLDSPHVYDTLSADNNGALIALNTSSDKAKYPYYVSVQIIPDPPGFDAGYASTVAVRVAWQPFAQNYRDYVRIITKY